MGGAPRRGAWRQLSTLLRQRDTKNPSCTDTMTRFCDPKTSRVLPPSNEPYAQKPLRAPHSALRTPVLHVY